MAMRSTTLLVALASVASCLQFSPGDGALHCSTAGRQCPSGYYCADDNTCWKNGHTPTTPPPDMAGAPDMLPMNMSCMLPSDCPAPTQACLVSACIQSMCGLISATQGVAPPNAQVAGDCQKHVCDANGNLTAAKDSTNIPSDPTGGCNTPSCNGSTPTLTPTASGTACTQTASGVCNGSGVCGVCKPGNVQCAADGKTVQTCSAAGQWVNGTVCRNACTAGQCSGACNPALDAPYCTGIDQLHSCSGTSWVTSTCTYACVGDGSPGKVGTCTGTCKPSSPTCSNTTTLSWCDASGTPRTQTCSYCLNGACVDCQPGAVQCCNSNAGNQTCDNTGHWGGCASCGGTYWSCSAGTCSCSAPDPCVAGDACGTRNDACGAARNCPAGSDGSCAAGYVCYYNTVSHAYKCKVDSTTTGCIVGCRCCDACCGKYCC
jgi:hypothetical protein